MLCLPILFCSDFCAFVRDVTNFVRNRTKYRLEMRSFVWYDAGMETQYFQLARQAMEHAYAPYSHYRVGACLVSADGSTDCGCNVENASFGATLCAERVALGSAIAHGRRKFTALYLVSDGATAPLPCGICRQMLAEFSDMDIVVQAQDGTVSRYRLHDLLPYAFAADGLQV